MKKNNRLNKGKFIEFFKNRHRIINLVLITALIIILIMDIVTVSNKNPKGKIYSVGNESIEFNSSGTGLVKGYDGSISLFTYAYSNGIIYTNAGTIKIDSFNTIKVDGKTYEANGGTAKILFFISLFFINVFVLGIYNSIHYELKPKQNKLKELEH